MNKRIFSLEFRPQDIPRGDDMKRRDNFREAMQLVISRQERFTEETIKTARDWLSEDDAYRLNRQST